jgi:hypothetical protein
MYIIDLYHEERQHEAKRMLDIINCLIYVYVIGMGGLIYFCIFPNSMFIIQNNN